MHLFLWCPKVQELWTSFEDYVKRFNESKITFNANTVFFNELVRSPISVVNFLCLVVKYYIYTQRCLAKNVDFQHLRYMFLLF